jgi:hypothetical protein
MVARGEKPSSRLVDFRNTPLRGTPDNGASGPGSLGGAPDALARGRRSLLEGIAAMKNIVMLGAGTGGALVANLLSHRLDLREWVITVIDREKLHVYQPGLLFLPFAMYG